MDNGGQENFVYEDLVKKLSLVTTPHPQHYNIGWIKDGQELRITWQCRLAYFINPFEDEVICDVALIFVGDALLDKPYLWDRHGTYQSQPQKVIVKIWNQWYGILEQQPTSMFSMISAKQTKKLINHAQKFALIMIKPQHSRKNAATSRLTNQRSSRQQQKIDNILEEYQNIFQAPDGVPLHC